MYIPESHTNGGSLKNTISVVMSCLVGMAPQFIKVTQHAAWWSNGSKYSKLKKTIEIQQVRLTEICGKVLSEKNAYKSVKTALLLSNVIDADHQNSCLFTNKGHLSTPLWVLIGVLANIYE